MIPAKILTDVIVTALEGGSNHFITTIEYPKNHNPKKFNAPAYADPDFYTDDFELTVHIDDDVPAVLLSMEAIEAGWPLFAAQYPTRAAAILDETYDADDADLAIQFFLFGEYIYG